MTRYKPMRPAIKVKFMQALETPVLRSLKKAAKRRGIVHVQELLRAVVIPEWLDVHRGRERDHPNARPHKPNNHARHTKR